MKNCLGLFSLAVVILTLGCGPSGPLKSTISGTVTFDGDLLDDATLQVDANDGALPEMLEIVNGEFSGEVTVGPKTLRFTAVRLVERQRDPAMGAMPPHENILPMKYGFESDIKLDVKPEGHSDLVYELKSD